MNKLSDCINDLYKDEKNNDRWGKSCYNNFPLLTTDGKGKIGEIFVSNLFKELTKKYPNYIITEDISDVNIKENHKHYDIKINDIKIEIKTSGMGSNGNYQHENIYTEYSCDMTFFVDISPDDNSYYLSIIPEKELPLGRDSDIFGRKHATLRKNKDNGYKLDFSKTTILSLENNNYCKKFKDNEEDNLKAIEFIKERIETFCGNFS